MKPPEADMGLVSLEEEGGDAAVTLNPSAFGDTLPWGSSLNDRCRGGCLGLVGNLLSVPGGWSCSCSFSLPEDLG